jgi:hypothetical protein
MEYFKQRLVEDKRTLDMKANSLSRFIGSGKEFLLLELAEQELLKEQCETMWKYSEILGKRILNFK